MKKIFLFTTTLFVVGLFSASAQVPLRIHANFGIAQATGDFAGDDLNIGIGYTINARYMFTEKLDAGLEYDASAIVTVDVDGADADATGLTGYMVKGYYSFFKSKVTPYFGLGLGLVNIEYPTVTITDSNGNETVFEGESTTNFGLAPEVGLYLGGFTLGAKYTTAGDTPDGSATANYIRYFAGWTFSFGE